MNPNQSVINWCHVMLGTDTLTLNLHHLQSRGISVTVTQIQKSLPRQDTWQRQDRDDRSLLLWWRACCLWCLWQRLCSRGCQRKTAKDDPSPSRHLASNWNHPQAETLTNQINWTDTVKYALLIFVLTVTDLLTIWIDNDDIWWQFVRGSATTTPAPVQTEVAAKPIKTRRVPVCACGEEKQSCDKCEKGFLEVTLRGEIPAFKDVAVKTRRAAVCKGCRKELAECPDCKMGFLEMTLKGMTPEFEDIVVEDKANTDEKQPEGLRDCSWNPWVKFHHHVTKIIT